MERYVEITAGDLFKLILSDKTKDIYYQHWTGSLFPAHDYSGSLTGIKNHKWFLHEKLD